MLTLNFSADFLRLPLKNILVQWVCIQAWDAASPVWSQMMLTPYCCMDHTVSSKGGEELTHSYLLPAVSRFTAHLSGTALGTEKSKEEPEAPGWRAWKWQSGREHQCNFLSQPLYDWHSERFVTDSARHIQS